MKRLSVGVWLDTRLFDDTANLEELGKFMLCLHLGQNSQTDVSSGLQFLETILGNNILDFIPGP